MKVLVVCGFHSNENSGIRICEEWGAKKNGQVYSELSELAGRAITDSEVTFLNVSKHTHHALVRGFFSRYTLEKLFEMYEDHLERKDIPKEHAEAIREYLDLWKRYKNYFPLWKFKRWSSDEHEKFKELKDKCGLLSKKYASRFHKKEIPGNIIFPQELHDFVYSAGKDPRRFISGLKQAHGKVVLDLHSTPSRDAGKNCDYGAIYLSGEHANGLGCSFPLKLIRREMMNSELDSRLGKYASTLLAFERGEFWKDAGFSYISIEIWVPTIEEKDDAELYRNFHRYPNFYFLRWLNNIFTRKDPFSEMIAVCTERPYVTDPKFYSSKKFLEAKQFVANVIHEVLEWGEKYGV